jgi:hypothetical protein
MAWVTIQLIRVYQALIGPHIGDCCRFDPSCSEYFVEALRRHGFLKGSSLGVRRLLRCHPFHPGGLDPVPAARCRPGRNGVS